MRLNPHYLRFRLSEPHAWNKCNGPQRSFVATFPLLGTTQDLAYKMPGLTVPSLPILFRTCLTRRSNIIVISIDQRRAQISLLFIVGVVAAMGGGGNGGGGNGGYGRGWRWWAGGDGGGGGSCGVLMGVGLGGWVRRCKFHKTILITSCHKFHKPCLSLGCPKVPSSQKTHCPAPALSCSGMHAKEDAERNAGPLQQ